MQVGFVGHNLVLRLGRLCGKPPGFPFFLPLGFTRGCAPRRAGLGCRGEGPVQPPRVWPAIRGARCPLIPSTWFRTSWAGGPVMAPHNRSWGSSTANRIVAAVQPAFPPSRAAPGAAAAASAAARRRPTCRACRASTARIRPRAGPEWWPGQTAGRDQAAASATVPSAMAPRVAPTAPSPGLPGTRVRPAASTSATYRARSSGICRDRGRARATSPRSTRSWRARRRPGRPGRWRR